MRTRYIANPLAPDGYPSAPILSDPIFTPLFVSLGFTGSMGIGTLTVANVLSAISAGGGYKEFKCQQ